MSSQKGFIINESVLESYTGPGGAVEIPAGSKLIKGLKKYNIPYEIQKTEESQ